MKSISNQILVYILIPLSIVFVGRFFYSVHIRTKFETERLEQSCIRKSERLALFLEEPIIHNDLNLIKTNISVEALDKNILSIQIFDQNNRLYSGVIRIKDSLHTIGTNQLPALQQDSIVRPVVYQGKNIGKVVLYPNKEPLEQLKGKLKSTFLFELGVLFLIVAIILFFALKRVVIDPLFSLKNWVSSINADNRISRPKLLYSVEIDTIIDSVSQLTNRLISANEENLRKSNQISEKESLITSISTNLPEGMIYRLITNDNGFRKFTYLSGSFEKIYGLTPEEGIADSAIVFDSIHREDVPLLLVAEAESKRQLSTFRCEVRMVNVDGTIRVSRFVSTPTVLEDGSVSWDGVELDITDLKKAQTDLQQNQFLLESITEGLPDSIFAKDLNGRYLFVNSALAKRANKSPQELLGKNNSDIFLRDEANKTMEMDLEIIKSGITQTYEEQLTTSSESAVFLTTKGPLKDAQGKTVGLFGMARDITELREREEALRVSQGKFEFAFNSSPNAVLLRDEQTGKCFETNKSTTNIFGYSQEEVLGKTTLELNMYKDPTLREKVYETLNTQGFVRNMEVICLNKSGEDLHTLLTIERHYIGEKPVLYINVQDVTERKQVELELQKLNLDKDRFISILGHDLRGPVNNTVSLLDILNMDMQNMETEEIKEVVDLVYQSAKNTSNLLDDVLLWATAKSGTMSFNPGTIDFKADCQRVIKLLQFGATAKKIAVETHCEDLLEVYADKNMLDTVLRNLISNALKFTYEGGKITITAEKTGECTVVSIADNGVGIAPEDVEKMFDKAQLFTSIGTNAEKGTGFGLKLCQDFIEKHNGKIWVESEVGKGTTFYFSLPNAI